MNKSSAIKHLLIFQHAVITQLLFFYRKDGLIIDGKEITWEDFGQMLMTYEGCNFKLQIFDESDEMD